MKKTNENDVFKEITNYISSLKNTEEIATDITPPDIFLIHHELGALFLSGKEADGYKHCFQLLLQITNEELISKKETEVIFQFTILSVLDLNHQDSQNFEDRLKFFIKEMRKKIKGYPIPFDVYYQVQGLSEEGLPFRFGNVQFCKFDDKLLSRFTNRLELSSQNMDVINSNNALRRILNDLKVKNKVIGVIQTAAVDPLAAKTKAIREIELTIDVINFFSDLIPYTQTDNGFIYLPGEYGFERIDIPVLSTEEKPTATFYFETVGPNIPFSYLRLLDFGKKNNINIQKISSLLEKQKSDFETKLISSIQWAGKATTRKDKEESFLLYAIALESLILIESDKEELNYRLSLRVAHLLGNTQHNRDEIFEEMKNLYALRSRIVHSGNFQISDSDINTIKIYTKSCILRLLTKRPFTSMKSKDDLVAWFSKKALG